MKGQIRYMQGIEIAEKFYNEYGRKMIGELFSEYEGRIAVGLVGNGSDCFGYDDEISRDHDFEPGFMMWLNQEDYDELNFKLSREYDKLPKEYLGLHRDKETSFLSSRYGAKNIGDFYNEYTGKNGETLSNIEWLKIPEYSLAAATNGKVFRDDLGEFSSIRNYILHGMPEDVRLKKIAMRGALMAQSGQYNYLRSMKHGERGAASLALGEFVKNSCYMLFLLNKKHAPFYKWLFRGVKDLEILSELNQDLEYILTSENSFETMGIIEESIEKISNDVIKELKKQNLTDGDWDYLEPHAFQVMDRIKDSEIRNMHVME